MGAHDGANLVTRILNVPTLLLAFAFLLPVLAPTLFGWLSGLLAIPVFIMLALYGTAKGTLVIRNGAILAAACAFILNLLPGTIFSLTLVPLGFSLNKSAEEGDNEIRTGMQGFIVLALSWLLFWVIYGIAQEMNPYTHLLQVLDSGFIQTFEVYGRNSDIPLETQVQLEKLALELREIIPKILPGILACTLLLTVWLNMLCSISLLQKLKPGTVPWKKYSEWRLPERVVWLPIIAGFAWAIGDGIINSAGLSLILVSTLLYFFQGLAVLIFFMDRWKIPLYLKILIYGILIFQSYGLLLLSIAGIADVWIDFRRRHKNDDQPDH